MTAAAAAVGFLGIGHLATAMVTGLVEAGFPREQLLLSPRGGSDCLSARWGIAQAPDNAALVARCGLVVLAVRPHHAAGAIEGLPWRADHVLLSVCAGVRAADLDRAAAPAQVARAMPLTAAALRASPTTLFPDHPVARDLLERLGPVVPLDSEDQFEAATISAAAYGWVQMLIGRSIAWSVAQGLPEDKARALVANTFIAAGRNVTAGHGSIPALLQALATPGGITERGLQVLDERGVPAAWDAACDAVKARLAIPSERETG